VTSQFDLSFSIHATDPCGFPIDVTGTQVGFERDSSTTATSREPSITSQQDVFTANGKTLNGLPFVNEQLVLYDSAGQLTHDYETGVIERVPVPDGSMFLSAGRVDFAAHPGQSVLITPDVGHSGNSGNLAEFCRALSG
jgi:hypothetical protein